MNPRSRSALLTALLMCGCLAGGALAAVPQKSPTAPTKVAAKKFKVLPSGLKYAVLRKGLGKVAEQGPVEVHYTGWLQRNGKKFDCSLERGEPFNFELGRGQVIKGWEQGVKGMREGEKRQLIIPPSLGFGPKGIDNAIPPNATLIFEVEMLKVFPSQTD